jgi:small-conductance mechanosensitive channel
MVPVNGVYLCIYRQGFYWLDKDFHLDLSGTRQNINLFKTKISEEDHRLLLLPNGDILTVFTSYVDYTVRAVNKAGIRFLKRTSHRNGISEYKLSNQTILYKDDIMSQLNNG